MAHMGSPIPIIFLIFLLKCEMGWAIILTIDKCGNWGCTAEEITFAPVFYKPVSFQHSLNPYSAPWKLFWKGKKVIEFISQRERERKLKQKLKQVVGSSQRSLISESGCIYQIPLPPTPNDNQSFKIQLHQKLLVMSGQLRVDKSSFNHIAKHLRRHFIHGSGS